jgi:hypothetical protein
MTVVSRSDDADRTAFHTSFGRIAEGVRGSSNERHGMILNETRIDEIKYHGAPPRNNVLYPLRAAEMRTEVVGRIYRNPI